MFSHKHKAVYIWNGSAWVPSLMVEKVGTQRFLRQVCAWDGSKWIGRSDASHFTPSMVDYSTWVNGTSGSQTGWPQNGTTNENAIVTGTNPWGKQDVMWRTTGAGDNAADGGWNGDLFPIDIGKAYRYSCWVNAGNADGTLPYGRVYLGFNVYDSNYNSLAAINRTDGSTSTNPYGFGGLYAAAHIGVANEWRLYHAYLKPAGYAWDGVADSTVSTMSGDWAYTGVDWIFPGGTVYARHRAYQYYTTIAGPVKYFYRPRFEVLDGNQPSISDLLAGVESGPVGVA